MGPRLVAVLTSTVAGLLLGPGQAAANGAFPDSFQLLLPAGRPQQVALATNFGIIISDDGGMTWTWTCERQETFNGYLYAVGASPQSRFFGLGGSSIAFSDDASCTWTPSRTNEPVYVVDYFPDRKNAARVLAIGQAIGVGSGDTYALVVSADGGATFGAPVSLAPPGTRLTGVESAQSDPSTIYLAESGREGEARISLSRDGGDSWTTTDVSDALGRGQVRILAVDPTDPLKLFVRVMAAEGDRIGVSVDGGLTFSRSLDVPGGTLRAFVILPSGTILAAGAVGATAFGARSADGGQTFADWPGVPHLLALAERDGLLYGAASNYSDPWAVGISMDEGLTFHPLGRYDSVVGVRDCARAACLAACLVQANRGLWPREVCGAPTDAPDAPPKAPPPPSSGSNVLGARDFSAAAILLVFAVWTRAILLSRSPRRVDPFLKTDPGHE